MSTLIKKTHVRNYAFAVLAEKRPALKEKMTRVSGAFFDKIEASVRQSIAHHIESMPSTGKTIR